MRRRIFVPLQIGRSTQIIVIYLEVGKKDKIGVRQESSRYAVKNVDYHQEIPITIEYKAKIRWADLK